MPKVSVIITLFNKAPYIKRAIESVQNQTVNDFEIIVVNDGSTDNGPDIVQSIKDERIILINQKNQGVSKARNRGVKESQSEFITFLDADDEWMENHLGTLLQLKEKFPQAGAYSSTYITCNEGGKLKRIKYKNIPRAPWEGIIPNYFKSAIEGAAPVATGVVGIYKNIFFEMSGFDEYAIQGEDLDLWARVATKYPIAFSWDIGVIYHMEAPNRICSNLQPIRYHPLIVNGKKSIRNHEIPLEILPFFKEYIAKKEIEVAARNILVGDMNTARKMIDQIETKKFFFEKFKCHVYSRLPPQVYRFIYRWKFILRPLRILHQ
ncbi:MAG: glycosyltransferase family 2 protein [Promethearchaeota archaeon]